MRPLSYVPSAIVRRTCLAIAQPVLITRQFSVRLAPHNNPTQLMCKPALSSSPTLLLLVQHNNCSWYIIATEMITKHGHSPQLHALTQVHILGSPKHRLTDCRVNMWNTDNWLQLMKTCHSQATAQVTSRPWKYKSSIQYSATNGKLLTGGHV